jgi:hypothetical protein
VGGPQLGTNIKNPIIRLKTENPPWGASRIKGELRHIGINISEPKILWKGIKLRLF